MARVDVTKLEPLFGASVERIVVERAAYVVARIGKPVDENEKWTLQSRVAIWNASTGKLALRVPGAVEMAWTPDGAQVGVWREIGTPTRKDGKRVMRSSFVFERYGFPDGKLISSLPLAAVGVDPIRLEFVKKYRGNVAKLVGGECGGAFTLYVLRQGSADAVVERHVALGKAPPVKTPVQEAKHAKTSPARLRALAKMTPVLARAAARNVTSTPELLVELAAHADVQTRCGVALHRGVALETLLALAADVDARVRQSAASALARAEGVPAAIYEQLARDKNKEVRRFIAAGARTPDAVRAILASDPEESVRHHLAGPHASSALLERMLEDPSPKIRAWIVTYYAKKLGATAITALAADPDAGVRQAALRATR